MTARTIRLVDTYCRAANLNDSVESVREWQARMIAAGPNVAPRAWREEAENEIREWTVKLDRLRARLRSIVAALTDHERDWLRRKCDGAKLARDLRAIGVEPNW